jgi:hypothetical protein
VASGAGIKPGKRGEAFHREPLDAAPGADATDTSVLRLEHPLCIA